MSDVFQAAAEATLSQVESSSDVTSQDGSNQNLKSSAQTSGDTSVTQSEVAQAVAELEKMDKFKFDGQEWTPKDLKQAIMRQQDYTKKTQALSQDRKTHDEDRKFYENLAYDLRALDANPNLASKFVSIYPEKFHKYADQYLKPGTQEAQPNQVQMPQPDVQVLSKLERFEKFLNEQETVKNEAMIKSTVDELSKKYPGTEKPLVQKMIMAEAYESHMSGVQLTPDVWEDIFKRAKDERDAELKAEYGELVKKQTEANAKSRDVGAGGGTAGRAPMKFTRFDDLAKHAESIAKGG